MTSTTDETAFATENIFGKGESNTAYAYPSASRAPTSRSPRACSPAVSATASIWP